MGIFDKFKKRVATPTAESTPQDVYIKRAAELIESAKKSTEYVNTAVTVPGFSRYYKQVVAELTELIELNEVHGISMSPAPRQNLEQINKHIDMTMDSFIRRAVSSLPGKGLERADQIQELLHAIRQDSTVFPLLKAENFHLISTYSQEADNIRREYRGKKNEKDKAALISLGENASIDCSGIDPLLVIQAMEKNIQAQYEKAAFSFNAHDSDEDALQTFQKNCISAKIPLAAEVRLEALMDEYRPKFQAAKSFTAIDQMEGHDFERWCAELLKKCGYIDVEVTKGSGDQGMDVVAKKDEIRYAIQCKCYSSKLGNKPVQEVYAGKQMYNCQVGAVMTNNSFTSGAIELAEKTGVLLWDRKKLEAMFLLAQRGKITRYEDSLIAPTVKHQQINRVPTIANERPLRHAK